MTGAVSLSLLAALGILLAVAGGIAAFLGTSPAVLKGAALGLALGAGGLAVETLVLRRALEEGMQSSLRVLLGGFGVRILVVFLGTLGLQRSGLADGTAFALAFVGGFVAFLPVLASLTRGRRRNGESGGGAGPGGTAS